MSFKKQAILMITNAVLGLLTCYLYLYFWIMFSFVSTIFSMKALLGALIPLALFGLFNFFLIKNNKKQGWIYASITYVSTILLFIAVFALT